MKHYLPAAALVLLINVLSWLLVLPDSHLPLDSQRRSLIDTENPACQQAVREASVKAAYDASLKAAYDASLKAAERRRSSARAADGRLPNAQILSELDAVNAERYRVKREQHAAPTDDRKSVNGRSALGEWTWLGTHVAPEIRKAAATPISRPIMSKHGHTVIVQGSSPAATLVHDGYTEYRTRSSACNTATGEQRNRLWNCQEQFGHVTYLADRDESKPIPAFITFIPDMTSTTLGSWRVLVEAALDVAKQTNSIVVINQYKAGGLREDHVTAWNDLFDDMPEEQLGPLDPSLRQRHPCVTAFVAPRDLVLDFSAGPSRPRHFRERFTRLHQFLHDNPAATPAFFRQMLLFALSGTGSPGYPSCRIVHLTDYRPDLKSEARKVSVPTCAANGAPENALVDLKRSDSVVHRLNSMGQWSYRRNSPHVGKLLVVIGGAVADAGLHLLESGFPVWKYTGLCSGRTFYCHESFGYLSYLADEDPAKPVADYVAFLHGHNNSRRHQRFVPIVELVNSARACAEKTKRYSVLYPVPTFRTAGAGDADAWNKQFGKYRKIDPHPSELRHYCCAQFVVPRPVIDANPRALYLDLLRADFNEQFTGANFEVFYHFLFHEPVSVDFTEAVCEPPLPPAFDHLFVDPNTANAVPGSALRADAVLVRTPLEPSAQPRNPRAGFEAVFGADYPPVSPAPDVEARMRATARLFQSKGHPLSVRRPRGGRHIAWRTEVMGYLSYLTYDVPRARYAVFVHGDEADPDALYKAVEDAWRRLQASNGSFAFVDYIEPAEQAARDGLLAKSAAERLNALWHLRFSAGPMSERCRGPKATESLVFSAGSAPSAADWGTRFVLDTSAISHACMVAAFIAADFDYEGRDVELFGFFWKFFVTHPRERRERLKR
ncbi:hypothetical protein DIPPA_21949 [Diplonema papillatum]|nr:hypothetical protein DIPPA_21949 [Diplonema papillatum]